MKSGKGGRRSGGGGGGGGGGIRKQRAPATRTDRDGDLAMDAAGISKNRGRKSKPDSGPRTQTRALDAIQKAITSNSDSQANVRQGRRGPALEQAIVWGWKKSKAASNRDGGHESLLAFLEKKLSNDPKTGARAKITKVCATLQTSGLRHELAASSSPVCSR